MPIKGQSPKEVMHTEMKKFKGGTLHSGSKKGPVVKNRKQAIAIALSESGQSKYDRSSHHKGNPGFDRSEIPHSPPTEAYQKHESREKEVMGAGYQAHESAERASYRGGGGHVVGSGSPATKAYTFRGTRGSGPLRLSGHSGAHQLGKRK